jgi:methylated-DNA-protein-cysteine methyltransferase related protein
LARVDEVVIERVLRAVEQVPPGRVVSYGDIGALVGLTPRHVGTVLRLWSGDAPWWRVTSRDGDLPGGLLDRAREHWVAEGIVVKPNGLGCRMASHRADLARWAQDYARATRDLPDAAG